MSAKSAQASLLPVSRHALAPVFTGSLGNIEAYIAEINRLPMLTQERETELALRYHENNDLAAAQELVLSHLRLVASIARNYLGYGLPHADLIQEGNIGLMKAVKRFDPKMGVDWFRMPFTGSRLKYMNTFSVTGEWSRWRQPRRRENCFSICAAIKAATTP